MNYIVNTDGGSRGNPGPAGFGFVITDGAGRVLLERAGYIGRATNNVAEYMAVVVALEEIAAADPDARVTVRADSKLVVEQLSGRWKIKNADLQQLAMRARRALRTSQVRYEWVPRAENAAADALANRAMDDSADFTRGSLGSAAAARSADEPRSGRHVTAPRSAADPHIESTPYSATRDVVVDDDAYVTPDPAPEVREAPATVTRRREGKPVTIVFVRHGETPETSIGAFWGGSEAGPDLTARGRDQAARAGDVVARLSEIWEDVPEAAVVWTSPMARARQTADAIAGRLGIGVEVMEDLREAELGAWQGLTSRDIHAGWPGELERWHYLDAPAPGGETFGQVAARVREVARDALDRYSGQTVVIVGHTVVCKTGIGTLTGTDPATWYDLRILPGSVSMVRLWPEAHEVLALGVPGELLETSDTPTLF